MRRSFVALAAVAALGCGSAQAAIDIYSASLYGANEVPGPGDPDGFGAATLLIDNVAGTLTWSILANNIGPVTGAHIHAAPVGSAGSVVVDFSGQLLGSGLADPDLASITPGTAAGFYVNVHTGAFTSGAIRGQLEYVTTVNAVPEPGTYALMLGGLGMVGFLARRRRR
jgi:hypothetical protein